MRRLGTGTGFAYAKLSEVVARSERSLATVRMTDWRCLPSEVRNLTPLPPSLNKEGGTEKKEVLVGDCVAVLVYFFEPFCQGVGHS